MLARSLVLAFIVAPVAALAQPAHVHSSEGRTFAQPHEKQPESKSRQQRRFEKKQRGCRAIPIPDECLN